ncbi:nitroreductase family protein [Arachnia propionica]|uniref:Nitroreductase domain-containing protein n=1 Tax=Arachnia propionica TaxID=1750 RepID=A0A3P1WP87_9ACTN|nr:nitroreductase family protein [Arachnia propionica]RRD47648.1 hypothetical protein EII35_14695 [Arachnia propionica]
MACITKEYVRRILERGREPMEPTSYKVDWSDAPIRHKIYLGVPRLDIPVSGGEIGAWWWNFDMRLRASYAPFDRRTRVTANNGVSHQQEAAGAVYARASTSGGGMYPVELYLVIGADLGIQAGVYHYSSAHHMLEQLMLGDFRNRILGALRGHTYSLPGAYVVATVRFWKNSFKYASFCYHVVTTDIGTLFGSWHGVAGERPELHLWFDEADLNQLLGLNWREESVFAVASLGSVNKTAIKSAESVTAGQPPQRASVNVDFLETSRVVRTFPWNMDVQLEMMNDTRSMPAKCPEQSLVPPKGRRWALPFRERLSTVLWRRTVQKRESSFGRFDGSTGMSRSQLSALLVSALGPRLIRFPSQEDSLHHFFRLSVFATRVGDIPEGAYQYEPQSHSLCEVPGPPLHPFLQYCYYLKNYNFEQASAILVISACPGSVISKIGPRGYRLMNAELGAALQRIYVRAASEELGCGAVYGFENVAIRERLQMEGEEWPLVLVLVGPNKPGSAFYRYVLPTEGLECGEH